MTKILLVLLCKYVRLFWQKAVLFCFQMRPCTSLKKPAGEQSSGHPQQAVGSFARGGCWWKGVSKEVLRSTTVGLREALPLSIPWSRRLQVEASEQKGWCWSCLQD